MRSTTGRIIFIAALLMLSVALGACSRTSPDGLAVSQNEMTLEEALAQVQSVDLSSFDTETQAQLRDSFSQALIASGQTRFTSAAPGIGVSDLALVDNGDGTVGFTWTYLNPGDYDQNSEVNVADLSALGPNLGKNSAAADWPKARVADGDRNGEVNIADITTLGANLLHRLDSYKLQLSTNGGADWSDVQDALFNTAQLPNGGGFKTFALQLATPVDGGRYRVLSVGANLDGLPSNVVTYTAGGGPEPGPVTGLAATKGTEAQQVSLSWDAYTEFGFDHYEVLRATALAGPFTHLADSATEACIDATAPAGIHLWYEVRAVQLTPGGDSPASSPNEGWAMDLPAAPTNLSASDGTSETTVTLSWTAVAGAMDYHIWRSAIAGSGHLEIGTTGNMVPVYTDASPLPSTGYYYVVAESPAGLSPASSEDSGFTALPAGPPALTIDNPPPAGSGTFADPYIVPADADFDFTLTDSVEGDVTGDPGSSYTVSDPNITLIGSTLLVGATPPPTFNFYGTHDGVDSNAIFFQLPAPPAALLIYPFAIHPHWAGVVGNGTQQDPYILHDSGFNPDSDADGVCEFDFPLLAEDQLGDPVDNEDLDWYCTDPTLVADINDTGTKGTFHVADPDGNILAGQLYAQDASLNESNHIYFELWP